jgi:electron transfer flavoprotein alpha subunit
MAEIFVLAEHRQGKLRDITGEMLGAGEKIAAAQGASLTAVLLGKGVETLVGELAKTASKVLVA